MNNYDQIKNMTLEELSTSLFVEIYATTKDEHIRRKWMVGLDGRCYRNKKELKEGVIKWLESDKDAFTEENDG